MSEVNPINAILGYESYFVTKLGFELGDDKWLKKNPIQLHASPEVVLQQFLKVYRREVRTYLKEKLGAESVSITQSRDRFRIIVQHPAITTYFLRGKPREGLDNLRSNVQASFPYNYNAGILFDSYNSHDFFPGYTKKAVLSTPTFTPTFTLIRRGGFSYSSALYKITSNNSFYKMFKTYVSILESLIRYHRAEMRAYKRDLKYIKQEYEENTASFDTRQVSNETLINTLYGYMESSKLDLNKIKEVAENVKNWSSWWGD